MTDPLDALSLIGEVFSWLALPIAAVMLAIGWGRRAWARRYRPVKAVITTVRENDAKLRWFGEGFEVHESVSPITGSIPAVGDARTVWVHPSRPESPRLDDPAHDGRALLIIGAIAAVVGILGAAIGVIAPFLQG